MFFPRGAHARTVQDDEAADHVASGNPNDRHRAPVEHDGRDHRLKQSSANIVHPIQALLPQMLAMAARDVPMLAAYRELPAALVAARLQHEPALTRRHPRQKAMLAAPWDTLGIPGHAHKLSILPQSRQPFTACRIVQPPIVSAHKERRACSTPH